MSRNTAPEWLNMSTDRAVYILEDMSPGQLYNLELRNFRYAPESGLTLLRAMETAEHAARRGAINLSDEARWACSMIAAKRAELEKSRSDMKWYIIQALRGELTADDGDLFGAPEDYWSEQPSAETPRLYNAVNGTARPGYVYVLRSPTGAYKIGYATNPADRLRTFTVKLPFEVEYELLIKTDNMRGLEAELHEYYSEKHINGEWFALTDDDLAELRQLSGAQ